MIAIENYSAELWQNAEASFKEEHGNGYTIWCDDRAVMSAGVVNIWHGVGHAWMTVHDDGLLKCHLREILRAFKCIIPAFDKHFHRLQADVLFEFAKGCKWLCHLGFKVEGVSYKYGPNKEDFFRYARING